MFIQDTQPQTYCSVQFNFLHPSLFIAAVLEITPKGGSLDAWRSVTSTPISNMVRMMFLHDSARDLLTAQKKAVARWLNRIFHNEDITAGNLMDKLDNGVLLCKLASFIHHRGEEVRIMRNTDEYVPALKTKYWENAKTGTFYARDNAEAFLRWCRKFGVNEVVLFESDGLVRHAQPRNVVLCLLEVGRIAAKFDIDPPGVVTIEPEPHHEDSETESVTTTWYSPTQVPSRSASSLSMYSPSSCGSPIPSRRYKQSELDKVVREIINKSYYDPSQIKRVSEGLYSINGKNFPVKLLRERHVVTRLGGGWETLENFLLRHDPLHVTDFRNTLPSRSYKKYKSIKARYMQTNKYKCDQTAKGT